MDLPLYQQLQLSPPSPKPGQSSTSSFFYYPCSPPFAAADASFHLSYLLGSGAAAGATPVIDSPSPELPLMEQAPAPAEYVIPTVEIPSWPAGPCGCPCCAPCYQGYYEGCRCCCCGGRLYAQPLPAPAGCGYRGCRTFSDEDPTAACSIM